MRAQQGLEATPLIEFGKSVEVGTVLAHVMVHIHKALVSYRASSGQCRRRNGDAVAHPASLDQQLAGRILVEQATAH